MQEPDVLSDEHCGFVPMNGRVCRKDSEARQSGRLRIQQPTKFQFAVNWRLQRHSGWWFCRRPCCAQTRWFS